VHAILRRCLNRSSRYIGKYMCTFIKCRKILNFDTWIDSFKKNSPSVIATHISVYDIGCLNNDDLMTTCCRISSLARYSFYKPFDFSILQLSLLPNKPDVTAHYIHQDFCQSHWSENCDLHENFFINGLVYRPAYSEQCNCMFEFDLVWMHLKAPSCWQQRQNVHKNVRTNADR